MHTIPNGRQPIWSTYGIDWSFKNILLQEITAKFEQLNEYNQVGYCGLTDLASKTGDISMKEFDSNHWKYVSAI